MLLEVINGFRQFNNTHPVGIDTWMSDNCTKHNEEMARRGNLFHSEPCYRNNWSEAVAARSCDMSFSDTLNNIVYDILGSDWPNKNIILSAGIIACSAVVINGIMWVTIRGLN